MGRKLPAASADHNRLLTSLGGCAAVARMLSQRMGIDPPITRQAVTNWRTRGIPFAYRATLAIYARELGKSVPPGFLGEPDDVVRPHSIRPPRQFEKGLLDEDVPAWLQGDA